MSNEILLSVFIVCTIAGFVKGLVGIGLPPIMLGLLTISMNLHDAITIVLIPSIVTNFYQAIFGKDLINLFGKFFYFYLTATIFIFFGSILALKTNIDYAVITLGILIFLGAFLNILGLNIFGKKCLNPMFQTILGITNGLLTGLTGSSAFPGAFLLKSIELSKEQLIQALGILFTLSSIALLISIQYTNVFNHELTLISIVSLLPVSLGMFIGNKIRKLLPITLYTKVFYFFLMALGGYIVLINYN